MSDAANGASVEWPVRAEWPVEPQSAPPWLWGDLVILHVPAEQVRGMGAAAIKHDQPINCSPGSIASAKPRSSWLDWWRLMLGWPRG
ncbi:MAG: hypothetical protein RJA36_1474 [Pseudomonadota bacterium]|jgi:hypothetical protein